MLHVGLLKFYVEVMGVVVTKVHRVWAWDQKKFLAPYISGIARARAESTDDVTKDILKLIMNSLYGMFLRNPANYRNVNLYTDGDAFIRAAAGRNHADHEIFETEEGFLGWVSTLKPGGVKLDSPRLLGFSILELSKLHMYRTHYLTIKPQYGPRAKLLMMDTDSFIYQIETKNVVDDMVLHNRKSSFTTYDLNTTASGAAKSKLFKVLPFVVEFLGEPLPPAIASDLERMRHKGLLGALKYEAGRDRICAFLGLMSKMYLLVMLSGKLERKGKGLPKKALKDKTEQDYEAALPTETSMPQRSRNVTFNRIGCKKQRILHFQQTKKGLASFNDKVYQELDGSRPLGHYRNAPVERS
jgi:hypothetical protein